MSAATLFSFFRFSRSFSFLPIQTPFLLRKATLFFDDKPQPVLTTFVFSLSRRETKRRGEKGLGGELFGYSGRDETPSAGPRRIRHRLLATRLTPTSILPPSLIPPPPTLRAEDKEEGLPRTSSTGSNAGIEQLTISHFGARHNIACFTIESVQNLRPQDDIAAHITSSATTTHHTRRCEAVRRHTLHFSDWRAQYNECGTTSPEALRSGILRYVLHPR